MRLLNVNRTLLSCVAVFCLIGLMASDSKPVQFWSRNQKPIVPERRQLG